MAAVEGKICHVGRRDRTGRRAGDLAGRSRRSGIRLALLVTAIRAMADEKLNESVQGAEYNFYFMLHGVVQHNLYHAGQIALLKSAL